MTENTRGLIAMLGASLLWGVLPLFYHLLADIPPLELFAQRVLWSMVFFLLILLAQGRLGQMRGLFRGRQGRIICFSAAMITYNWLIYLVAIVTGQVLQSSLGYYIFPLAAVVLGMVLFGERLTRIQTIAVSLAAVAVLILSFGAETFPWIAVTLAISFGLYSAAKKGLSVPSILSVAGEVALVLPFALAILVAAHAGWLPTDPAHPSAVFGRDWGMSLLLVTSGPLTVLPLMLMGYATQRIRLGTLGLIQYVNPTLQFMVATLFLGEPFGHWHLAAFGLIWVGLLLYSWEGWRRDRQRAGARDETH